jgi:hypothetical protein
MLGRARTLPDHDIVPVDRPYPMERNVANDPVLILHGKETRSAGIEADRLERDITVLKCVVLGISVI